MSNQVEILEGLSLQNIPFDTLFEGNQPVLLKGLVNDWPLVKAGHSGGRQAVIDSLVENDSKEPFLVYNGANAIDAKFGYNAACTGFNYTSHRSNFEQVIAHILSQIDQKEHDYLYVNSLRLAQGFPTLAAEHTLHFDHAEFAGNKPVAKIWLGTESVAAAHFDLPRNIACCVHGKRRFTLFEPSQIENLYPGPLSPTPGGQVITMADLANPNYEKFPRLKHALDEAYIVDMEPGDALYYPSMWWHQVQAFDRFNVMINFWWMNSPAFMGNPMDVLSHGMLSLRDRPESEKQAWKVLFDYYIFGDSKKVVAHLPEECQGPLAEIDFNLARRLRSDLLNKLNR